jgi:hypothetical protein
MFLVARISFTRYGSRLYTTDSFKLISNPTSSQTPPSIARASYQ